MSAQYSEVELTSLKNSALLHRLPAKIFDDLIEISDRVSFEKGDILLKEGAWNDFMYILISGAVSLHKDHANQANYLITALHAGDSVGEMRIIKDGPCSLTVEALEPVIAMRVTLSQLHSPQYKSIYNWVLDSLVIILTTRLAKTNENMAGEIHHKKKIFRRLVYSFFFIAILGLTLFELSLALYYFNYPDDFCNSMSATPALTTKGLLGS